uniref:Uncharacterized mitochondrial protein AtMg00810-like n=1 Tax=Tanacetum cinerariifolium TaxID=118510 RepID=A0A699JE19_TANCI|nr:uncharacterized mitochondrial protein AtMg00810-like [Tanacetum cinerariifolium]
MGELTFFLGLQVKQKKESIFISQDTYVAKILKKFGFSKVKTVSTPMETQTPLLKDEDGEEVDIHIYRSMIGSLMYLTSSRPDIMFAVCACARYQVKPKVSHLHTCKKQTVVANSISKAEYVVASSSYGQIHVLVYGMKVIITESSVRRDLQLADKDGDGPRHQDTMRDTSAHTSSSDNEALDKEDTSKQERIDEIDVDEDIGLVSTHDDVSTQDNIVQDEGIKDVGEEKVVEVVTNAKMIIDVIVDVAQVTTAIADIPECC